MLRNKELIEKNRWELTFDVARAAFEEAVSKVYRKQAKRIMIPGFRRGKAPRSIIEKMYGKGVFHEDAINEVLPDAYEDAAKASELEIVGRPEFDVEPIEDGDIVFKAKVYVKPEVKIDGYKGIKVTRTVEGVTDDEVNAEIDRVRARNSRMIEITDRPAAMGDTANIDFDGYVDGKAFDGGKGEKFDLVLGSGNFIPGFEDQVVGHAIGDEFDVNVPFPADYSEASLAGKDSVFKCKLNGIKLNEKPELDDDFVKDVSEFDTVAEYTADVKAKLEESKKKAADSEVESKLMEQLVEKMEADIPQVMFDAEAENLVRDYDTRLRMQGLDLATYMKYTGQTLDQLREQMKPQAERQVKMRLALEQIAKKEKIEVADDDVEAEYKRLSEAYGVDIDNVKKQVAAEDLAADLKVQKAVELVKSSAKITDEAPKAEKKTAAKKSTKKDAEAAEEKPAAKKASTKKAESAAEKAPAKKTSAKKADEAEKPAAKKTAAKKADDAEKAPAKKTAAKKADEAEKPAAKKTAAKKADDAEKAPAKKAPAKKADDAKKPAAKKTAKKDAK